MSRVPFGRRATAEATTAEPSRPVRSHPHTVEGDQWGIFAPGQDDPIAVVASRERADRVVEALQASTQPERFEVIPVEVTIVCPHPRGGRR